MDRRKFIRSFVSAVATVAIGLKVAEGVPKVHEPEWQFYGGALGGGKSDMMRVDIQYGSYVMNPNGIVRINEV